eukprot:356660-Chlamydomonas_euryale.AAC.1
MHVLHYWVQSACCTTTGSRARVFNSNQHANNVFLTATSTPTMPKPCGHGCVAKLLVLGLWHTCNNVWRRCEGKDVRRRCGAEMCGGCAWRRSVAEMCGVGVGRRYVAEVRGGDVCWRCVVEGCGTGDEAHAGTQKRRNGGQVVRLYRIDI